MAIYSGLFMSVNGDRKYNAWWFAKYFSTFIGNGVFPNPSINLQVVENENMTTTVKPGLGWINGYFLYTDSDHVLQHDLADGVLKRIDTVVMRLNYLTRQIEIDINKGLFSSEPIAPALQRDADAYELALADVLINNGATQITQANITDLRLNKELCGIVHGTVDQVDTTTIFNQYQAWFNSVTDGTEQEIADWQQQQYEAFNNWFADLQDILDGDVAANLANRILNLELELATHELKKASKTEIGHVQIGDSIDVNNGKISVNKENVRMDPDVPLRTEVVSSLPLSASKGQIVFLDDVEEPSFKGFNGGKWV